MRSIIITLLFLSGLSLKATDDPNWAVSTIPAELKVKANAIIRLSEVQLCVANNGTSEQTIHIVTTVLNENGERFGNLVEMYDKYMSVSGLEGVVFDQYGKKIKKMRTDEFLDISAISGFSIYEDNRVKVANPKVGNYPYTVEYRYKVKYRKFMALPSWYIYPAYNVSIQKSIFSLFTEPKANVLFKGNNRFSVTPTSNENNGGKTIRWEVENLPALEIEPLSPDFSEVTPQLQIAPVEFEMDGYNGSNKSWKDFGEWSSKLCQNKDTLPQPTIDKVKSMVADAKTNLDKAKLLYEYMQGKVRYVSIQVGIGSWQPFSAETVDRLSYGDCKALTNYMQTLLKTAGIKSYYCLVRAGDDAPNMNKNFVCSQFNHVFLMLPNEHDTIFLECTSQFSPFGYNGTFTDDRDILVIDGTNSYVKHTNVYGKDHNKTIKTANIKIDLDLKSSVEQTNKYIGVATEMYRFLMQEKPEKQREVFLRDLGFKQVKIQQLSYNEKKDIIPVIDENVSYSVPSIAQITGSKTMIIPFNQVAQLSELKRVNNRKTDIVIRRAETETDTIRFQLPTGLSIDKLPIEGSFKSPFGSYKLNVKATGNKIEFIRTLEWEKGKFEPEKYLELVQYQKKINEMDRQVIILRPV